MTYGIRILTIMERNDLNREELQCYIEHLHTALDSSYHDQINHRHLAAQAEQKVEALRKQIMELEKGREIPASEKDNHIKALQDSIKIHESDKEKLTKEVFDLWEQVKDLEASLRDNDNLAETVNTIHQETIEELNLLKEVTENLLLATFAHPQLANFYQARSNLMNLLSKGEKVEMKFLEEKVEKKG